MNISVIEIDTINHNLQASTCKWIIGTQRLIVLFGSLGPRGFTLTNFYLRVPVGTSE